MTEPLHEVECPSCGATIRARMADASTADSDTRRLLLCSREARASGQVTVGESRLPVVVVLAYIRARGVDGTRAAYPDLTEEELGVVERLVRDMDERGRQEAELDGEPWPPDELVQAAALEVSDSAGRTTSAFGEPLARAALSCPAVTEYVEGLRRTIAGHQRQNEQWQRAAAQQLSDAITGLRRERDEARAEADLWHRRFLTHLGGGESDER